MTYATQQDLIDRFGEQEILQLSDRDHLGQINAGVVTEALEDADDLINGLLSGRYAVPFAPVPAIIRQLALPVARYNLHRDSAPDRVQKAYDAAYRTLTQIAAGSITLGEATAAPTPGDAPQTAKSEAVFTRDTLDAY